MISWALITPVSAANNFGSWEELQDAVNYTVDYTQGPDGNQTEYFTTLFENVGAKAEAGFPISATDIFGQFWGTYLPEEGLYKNYSQIAGSGTAFSEGDAPMPIIVLGEVIPGQSPEIGGILYPGNNETNGFNLTSYEVNPYEFGSWVGGRIQAFYPTRYLGTAMSNNSVANSSECVEGFDKFTFIQGSTASAFPAWFIDLFYDIPIFAKRGLSRRQDGDVDDGGIEIPPSAEDNGLVFLVNQTAVNFNQTFNESMWATYPNPFEDYNAAMRGVDELLLVRTGHPRTRQQGTNPNSRSMAASRVRPILSARTSSPSVASTLSSSTKPRRMPPTTGSTGPTSSVSARISHAGSERNR